MKERMIGVVLIVSGGLLTYFCVYQPLASARSGAPEVYVSIKGSLLAPLGPLGLMYLVLGPQASVIMGTRDRQKPNPAAYILGIGVILLGIGLYLWVRSALQAYGYDFHGQF
jgi:hypothetical protein